MAKTFPGCTLAYRPKEFMHLASAICMWAADEAIYASVPTVVEVNDVYLLHVNFGHSPACGGDEVYFGYDEFNEEFVLYGGEECEDWDFGEDLTNNVAQCSPMRFAKIEAIHAYLTGA